MWSSSATTQANKFDFGFQASLHVWAIFSLCAPRKWHIKNFLIRDGVRVKTFLIQKSGWHKDLQPEGCFSKPKKNFFARKKIASAFPGITATEGWLSTWCSWGSNHLYSWLISENMNIMQDDDGRIFVQLCSAIQRNTLHYITLHYMLTKTMWWMTWVVNSLAYDISSARWKVCCDVGSPSPFCKASSANEFWKQFVSTKIIYMLDKTDKEKLFTK